MLHPCCVIVKEQRKFYMSLLEYVSDTLLLQNQGKCLKYIPISVKAVKPCIYL